jgi:hypothetical protein
MAAGPSEHGTQNMEYVRTLLNRKPARPRTAASRTTLPPRMASESSRAASTGFRSGQVTPRIVRKLFQ